jgi:hypothetical protein
VAAEKQRTNPFYVLLVAAGALFAITACGYAVMALKQMREDTFAAALAKSTSGDPNLAAPSASFVDFFDRHGVRLMVGELVVLGIATLAAIGTDRFWTRDQE